MNERIQELADKAIAYADDSDGPFDEAYTKKFAELIILECSSICYKNFDNGDEIATVLMNSFGVEE